jgi:hypothetical protein
MLSPDTRLFKASGEVKAGVFCVTERRSERSFSEGRKPELFPLTLVQRTPPLFDRILGHSMRSGTFF